MKLKEAEKKIRGMFGADGFAHMIPRQGVEIGNLVHLVEALDFDEAFKMLEKMQVRANFAAILLHSNNVTVREKNGMVEVVMNEDVIVRATTVELCWEYLQTLEPHRILTVNLEERARKAFGPAASIVKRGGVWHLLDGEKTRHTETDPAQMQHFIRTRELFLAQLAEAKKRATFYLGSRSFARKVGAIWEAGVRNGNEFDVRGRGRTVVECFQDLRVREEKELAAARLARNAYAARKNVGKKLVPEETKPCMKKLTHSAEAAHTQS